MTTGQLEEEGLLRNLHLFFSLFGDAPETRIGKEFLTLKGASGGDITEADARGRLKTVYEDAVALVEDRAAEQGFPDHLISLQRGLYGELEYLISLDPCDERHHVLLVIPVADRPAMLGNCVGSLIEQCRTFGYGGTTTEADGRPFYRKISLFIFDDSKDEANKDAIREIAGEAADAGIRSRYVGLDEQSAFLSQMKEESRRRLSRLIGGYNGAVSSHKGASLTRNIAYLLIQAMLSGKDEISAGDLARYGERVLVYFLDSDEEFRIRTRKGASQEDIPFINYFYWLDRLFSVGDVEVLTGKVVGDPPVTPAVMINTFLDDLILFLGSLQGLGMEQACPFHESIGPEAFSAEYHDLGKLFGYRPSSSPKRYRCNIEGSHTLRDCFEHLSERATEFFHGLHPTRVQLYSHTGGFARTEPARTVYTGNYVFSREGLKHFIPFADLGLRMAGPTLGRILKSKISSRFVSANLPLLHKRTVAGAGAEFRSGIKVNDEMIDLSTECFRQFWGDVMLFSVAALASAGYPVKTFEYDTIALTVRRTQDELWAMYREKFAKTDEGISRIRRFLSEQGWWNGQPERKDALRRFLRFCDISERNFGIESKGYKILSGQIDDGEMLSCIIGAIHLYREDEAAWNAVMEEIVAEAGPGK